MCASHSSEDFHITRAKNMLSKIKAEEYDLRCGGHPAVSEGVNREWITTRFVPTGICNNCSGKHVAMMAGAEALGVDVKDYHLPNHPMQLEVKRVVDGLADDPIGQVEWGVDECTLPAPAYPLFYLAQKYATFADAVDAVKAPSLTRQRIQNFAFVFNAMAKHLEQVGRTGHFCTVLMQSYREQLFGKVGADASYRIGVQESEDTRRLGGKGHLEKPQRSRTAILRSSMRLFQRFSNG